MQVLSEMTLNTPGIFVPRNNDLKHISGSMVSLYNVIAKGMNRQEEERAKSERGNQLI